VAPHLMKGESEGKAPKSTNCLLTSARPAAGGRKAGAGGDPITVADSFELLRKDLAVARAFDNRVGTFAVAEALRLASESGAG